MDGMVRCVRNYNELTIRLLSTNKIVSLQNLVPSFTYAWQNLMVLFALRTSVDLLNKYFTGFIMAYELRFFLAVFRNIVMFINNIRRMRSKAIE